MADISFITEIRHPFFENLNHLYLNTLHFIENLFRESKQNSIFVSVKLNNNIKIGGFITTGLKCLQN